MPLAMTRKLTQRELRNQSGEIMQLALYTLNADDLRGLDDLVEIVDLG
jgi:hypothetical protein